MKVVKLNPDGIIEKEVATYIGKPFSLLQRLKKGGVGSPRLIYISGIKQFDEFSKTTYDTNYVNFEKYSEGYAIRFFKRFTGYYRGWVCLVRYDEVSIRIITDKYAEGASNSFRLTIKSAETFQKYNIPARNYGIFRKFLKK